MAKNENLKRFHFDRGFFDEPRQYGELLLFQAGDISCKGGYFIPTHVQLCYELSYIVHGKGVFRTNGIEQAVSEGMLCLNLPGQTHEGVADVSDPFRYFYVGFDFMNVHNGHTSFLGIKRSLDRCAKLMVKDELGVEEFFLGLIGELLRPRIHMVQMVNLYLQQIVIVAHRSLRNERGCLIRPMPMHLSNSAQMAYQIINYIDTNLLSLSSISSIADELGYSHSYLSHLFARETGQTVQSYFNQRRMDKSADMLLSGQHSISEIAETLNYASLYSFSKAFKKYFGIAPSRYQQLHA